MMRLINKKYRKLEATIDYLGDEVVIAQAWKKTAEYMRRHNWYADTLALDISSLGLESNVISWAKQAIQPDFIPYDMELVPAPKSQKWIVDETGTWIPQKSINCDLNSQSPSLEDPLAIRPLAHLSVRDQTLATACMLCLADAVETRQGDCSESNYSLAQGKKIFSYGNRLLCDWENEKAWFRWGNNQTYRKFYTDYQNFLKRPVSIGRYIAENQEDEGYVFIVSLDLSKYYDNIDKDDLIERLKSIYQNEENSYGSDAFWDQMKKIINWKWNDDAISRASDLNIELGSGLPQGLVAAGFFANAYLIDFDHAIGRQIGLPIPDSEGVTLHDYCRYVDDLRFVVSVAEESQINRLTSIVKRWTEQKLKKFGGKSLSLNGKKIKAINLADLDSASSISERITHLQDEISGPMDRDALDGAINVLEGLLTTPTDGFPELKDNMPDGQLIKIAKFDHDIRSDTLMRFTANRLERLMKHKRLISTNEPTEHTSRRDLLDNESELLAKKLIWAWMQDPSLSLVLRKAFEIFPSSSMVEAILEALLQRCSFIKEKITNEGDNETKCLVDYLIADIFRFCVDFTLYFQMVPFPSSTDPDNMLAVVEHYAQKVLNNSHLPTFIQRQALFFLAVMQRQTLIKDPEVSIQHSLHAILSSAPIPWKHQRIALYEIASQITNKPAIFARQLADQIEILSDEKAEKAIDELAKRGGDFWNYFWKRMNSSTKGKKLIAGFKWAAPLDSRVSRYARQNLGKLICSKSNGFIHEAALLKLALALISYIKIKNDVIGCSPLQLFIKPQKSFIDCWDKLWRPDAAIPDIQVASSGGLIKKDDPRFQTPSWLGDDEDANAIYWVGSILRAAVIGQNDFTNFRWRKGSITGYKGLQTGWYKRSMGMMHAPEALVGEYATLSTWASELLMACLQWPGFQSTHIKNAEIKHIDNLNHMEKILKDRIVVLDKLHCESSGIPVIISNVSRKGAYRTQKFRIVTVQQLMPKTQDFVKIDPTLSLSPIKERNREHLAKICSLTYKTLEAMRQTGSAEKETFSDLIVFPEVSVHPKDQDLLKRLADKTKSMVFAGMIFSNKEGLIVNYARWFIPDYTQSGRRWVIRDQGKAHLTNVEKTLGISSYRPCQHVIEVDGGVEGPFRLSGAICYDATDLKLAADLRNITDLFIIVAHNKDVKTFDSMVAALHYHMYQHVVVVNKGQYGGSTMQAPYKEPFDRLISHAHGVDQLSINVADLDLAAFRRKKLDYKAVKTPPAGVSVS